MFVEIAEHIEGLAHDSTLSDPWPRVGDTLAVRVLSIDVDTRKLTLAPA